MDSSAVLRLVLHEAGAIPDLHALEGGVTSSLTTVECLRTLDRRRLQAVEDLDRLVPRFTDARKILARLRTVELDPEILHRASEPFIVPLATLDAIHLATALAWQEESEAPLVMMTHDASLACAARAYGMEVLGG